MNPVKTIGIVGNKEDSENCISILSALAHSCELSIRSSQINEPDDLDGFIVLNTSSEWTEPPLLRGRSYIRVIQSDLVAAARVVRFSTAHITPVSFKGQTLVTESAVPHDSEETSGAAIAITDGKPVWTSELKEGVRRDTCWVSRPWINKGECIVSHLNPDRFLNLLPILEWLRWICDWHQWEHPSLRACFMFDDPNLHAIGYGFINFNQLAAEGRHNNYHTSFATVPLDSYYVNSVAAQAIRENRQTLSLLIHGNNHTYRELADRQTPAAQQLALMKQALLRINRLEQKAKITVPRVMAPPHGICSAEMMSAMAGAGFEAVCVSHGSVLAGNPEAKWAIELGSSPAFVIGGLSVIPRFGLNRKPENQVLLAAYLNQPIIPVGHHWDLVDGTDILSSTAHIINGLGPVEWGDMAAIARSNYRSKIQGNKMHVKTFARTTTVRVPWGVSELELEARWLDPEIDKIECRIAGHRVHRQSHPWHSNYQSFAVPENSIVDLVAIRQGFTEMPTALPQTSLKTIARRVLVEMRDRSMPYFPRSFVRR